MRMILIAVGVLVSVVLGCGPEKSAPLPSEYFNHVSDQETEPSIKGNTFDGGPVRYAEIIAEMFKTGKSK